MAWGLGAGHPERVARLTSLSTPHGPALAGSLVRGTQRMRSWYLLVLQLPGDRVIPMILEHLAAHRA